MVGQKKHLRLFILLWDSRTDFFQDFLSFKWDRRLSSGRISMPCQPMKYSDRGVLKKKLPYLGLSVAKGEREKGCSIYYYYTTLRSPMPRDKFPLILLRAPPFHERRDTGKVSEREREKAGFFSRIHVSVRRDFFLRCLFLDQSDNREKLWHFNSSSSSKHIQY